jgi:acetyltransferase
VVADPGVDALLVMHAPTAVTGVAEVAAAVLPALGQARIPAVTCWLGAPGPDGSPGAGASAAVPAYRTPEEALDAFRHVVRHHQRQELLLEAPAALPGLGGVDLAAARALVSRALAHGRSMLTEAQSKDVLAAYGIPVVETRIVRDTGEAAQAAEAIGYPVALKILSPDIAHKSDVGGVALNLGSAAELRQAGEAMLRRCREAAPQAHLEGFTVQQMVRRGGALELFAGISLDATFGPVILFGQGGTGVEVIADRAVALPPLNARLARDLIEQTRIARLLAGYREHPAADLAALERTLVALAQLAADVPELVELDINPLLADERGVLALDARIRVAAVAEGTDRFAIRPYPAALEEQVRWGEHSLLLRPIRPEDNGQHRRFLARCSPEDLRARFFAAVKELPDRDLAHLTQIDYEREMAFIALDVQAPGETLAVVRASTDPDNSEAEIAALVRTDLKGRGLGRLLLEKLIRYCRSRGTRRAKCDTSRQNLAMTRLAESAGFRRVAQQGDLVSLTLELAPETCRSAQADPRAAPAGHFR